MMAKHSDLFFQEGHEFYKTAQCSPSQHFGGMRQDALNYLIRTIFLRRAYDWIAVRSIENL